MIAAGRGGRVLVVAAAVVAMTVVALVVGATVGGPEGPGASSVDGALPGFDEVAFRVTTPEGRRLDWCALLAATRATRERGLMGQRNLRGYDAMVFRFPAPTTSAFYMYRTPRPLSIAWFDGDGRFVSATDMPPCAAEDPSVCPTYPSAGPYLHAVEVDRGGLDRLGVGPGATLSFTGGGCA